MITVRPALYSATLSFTPGPAARAWEEAWDQQQAFRRLLRSMTAAFGMAFLLDAAARVVMAYTLPLDAVPVLSSFLLLAALPSVVVAGRSWARRSLARPVTARGATQRAPCTRDAQPVGRARTNPGCNGWRTPQN